MGPPTRGPPVAPSVVNNSVVQSSNRGPPLAPLGRGFPRAPTPLQQEAQAPKPEPIPQGLVPKRILW
jgi:hypothetical protein